MQSVDKPKPEEIVDLVRTTSIYTGVLSGFQEQNLKLIPLVIFGENLSNEVSIDFEKMEVTFNMKGTPDYPSDQEETRCLALITAVYKFMGAFSTGLSINNRNLLVGNVYVRPISEKKRVNKPSKSKGKGRLRKVRKRK